MFRVRACLTNTYLASFDLAVAGACYFAVRPPAPPSLLPLSFLLVLWLGFSSYFGVYRSRRLDSPLADWVTLAKVGAATWTAVACAPLLLPALGPLQSVSIRFTVLTVGVLALAKSALRLTMRELRSRGYDVKNLVLAASPEMSRRLDAKISQRSHYGYRILKRFVYLEAGEGAATPLAEEVREYLESTRVDDLIVALPARANDVAAALVGLCDSRGINVRIVPDLFPMVQADTQIYDLDGIPLVNARLYPTEYFGYAVLKRTFDVLGSLLVLVALSPLYLLLALLVRATSLGPALFAQERVGMNGRRFRMLKFRTMRQCPSLDPDWHWTVRNDAFITPVGRWLRRTNLDELPQFLNVLKGDMSIVGPRPERPFFLERFRREVPEYMARHYVKSGMTGWAQVHGWRGDTPIPERVAHDLYYIRNWAVALDVKIILLTLRTLFQRGAG
jgi:exopolysaccharide biosynthesis polyprenyl glycosylphosphotransferase